MFFAKFLQFYDKIVWKIKIKVLPLYHQIQTTHIPTESDNTQVKLKIFITMKATFKNMGTKFVYFVDGQKVRTSQRATPYEYVAVRLQDGKFVKILACGQEKTCIQAAIERRESIRRMEVTLQYLAGEITYKQYLDRVGFAHAMCRSFFKEEVEREGMENVVRGYEVAIARAYQYTEEVIRFVEE